MAFSIWCFWAFIFHVWKLDICFLLSGETASKLHKQQQKRCKSEKQLVSMVAELSVSVPIISKPQHTYSTTSMTPLFPFMCLCSTDLRVEISHSRGFYVFLSNYFHFHRSRRKLGWEVVQKVRQVLGFSVDDSHDITSSLQNSQQF